MNTGQPKPRKFKKRIFVSVIFILLIPFFVFYFPLLIPYYPFDFPFRYKEFKRIENPEKTHALLFYEDTWWRLGVVMPGQGGDIAGKIRLIDQRGKTIRLRKRPLIRRIDWDRIYWKTNSVFSIDFGDWKFDGVGSYDEG